MKRILLLLGVVVILLLFLSVGSASSQITGAISGDSIVTKSTYSLGALVSWEALPGASGGIVKLQN